MINNLRNTYKEFPRHYWILMYGWFIDRVGSALFFPFLALYITDRFQVGMTEVGKIFALYAITSVIGSFIGGALTDKLGRKRMSIFGLLVSGLSSLLLGLISSLNLLYGIVLFIGLFSSIGEPAQSAMVADILPENKRNEGYGILRVIANLAVVIGPAVGGILAARSYMILFVLDAILSTITAAIVFFYLPETKPEVNIDQPQDVRHALNVRASGIGLFRTEFLYLNQQKMPTENDHFNAYMRVIRGLNKQPIIIRTMDLGADKQFENSSEKVVNPSLGLRGIRMSLGSPSLFIPQLRAILRASAHGRIRMMIPMMSSLNELLQVLALIKETRKALREENIPFNPKMPVGGMIEVPAAAISADLFAPHLDFFSIGTNDLIQYALAIDRVDDEVSYLYDPLHPAVLRLIEMTVRAADKAGIPVTLCGEMAGDTRLIEVLLGLGLRQLSMDPANLLEVKSVIRQIDIGNAKKMSRRLLAGKDTRNC